MNECSGVNAVCLATTQTTLIVMAVKGAVVLHRLNLKNHYVIDIGLLVSPTFFQESCATYNVPVRPFPAEIWAFEVPIDNPTYLIVHSCTFEESDK